MRFLAFIFLVTVTTFSQTPTIEPGVSEELARWRAARYSDVRYKLDLTLEKMSPVLKGTIEIRVAVRDAGTGRRGDAAIVLDWRKIRGFEDRSTVSNVSINGSIVQSASFSSSSAGGERAEARTLSYEESNEHLVFRDGVVSGENVIKLDFTSPILPSGSAITRYIDKEDGSEYIYSLFVPSDASTAFPVFDQPDLKARFTLNLEVPILWQAVSNSQYTVGSAFDLSRDKLTKKSFRFSETKPISTYVFAFAAGPWQQVSQPRVERVQQRSVPPALAGGAALDKQSTSSSAQTRPPANAGGTGSSGDISTSIHVRKSQLAKFRPHAAEVFRLNREGIKFLEHYFNYKFPFPKYDIVLIPEFPFGGMEHAGATFLRESAVIFPQEPTKSDYISRANVIFHEAAHQWFGDTVTMRWFDDLWLKEGFAEFMAYKTLEKVMPDYNAWKVFYERNKQAAYLTDSTKGTTPIYQEIKNLSAAKSAYGNIVYRKAPSFLKQAEFYIGPDKFQTAVRAFLKKHEFANAGWADLVKEFESASDSDLKQWAQTWVKERSLPLVVHCGIVGGVDRYGLKQVNKLGDSAIWMMKFDVLLIGPTTQRLTKTVQIGPDSAEQIYCKNGAFIYSQPGIDPKWSVAALIPNRGDYGYGIFLLDDKSRDYVLKNVQNEKDDFLRSMMYGALWDSVREAELDPKAYVELAVKNLPSEKDETIASSVLGRVSTAMTYYMSEPGAVATGNLRGRFESMLIEKMRTSPTLGQRITFYRALLNVASTENARSVLKQMLTAETPSRGAATGPTGRKGAPNSDLGSGNSDLIDPKSQIPNPKLSRLELPLKTKDRFDIVTKLASLGDPDAERLLAELEKKETSDDAKRYAYAARAAFPTKEAKEKYWNDFINNKEISESWIEAAMGPFNSVRQAELTLPYLERALKELPNHKRNRKIFFVNGWLGAFIGGQRSPEALAIVNKFLADNPNLDRDLRLKILENVDVIERAVKIRGKYGN